jgi:hypothetical protein
MPHLEFAKPQHLTFFGYGSREAAVMLPVFAVIVERCALFLRPSA